MTVYLLFREWGGDTDVLGVYAKPPTRMEMARMHLLRYSKDSCWKDGRRRRYKPTEPKSDRPRRIPFGVYGIQEWEVTP